MFAYVNLNRFAYNLQLFQRCKQVYLCQSRRGVIRAVQNLCLDMGYVCFYQSVTDGAMVPNIYINTRAGHQNALIDNKQGKVHVFVNSKINIKHPVEA